MDMLKWTEMKGTGPNEAFIETDLRSAVACLNLNLHCFLNDDRKHWWAQTDHHIFIHLISTENIQFKTQAEAEGLSALTTSERKVRSVSAEH